MTRILVTGGKGQLGRCIADVSSNYPDFEFCIFSREGLDITDISSVQQVLSDVRPNFVINAAAYTNVDGAESQAVLANQINHLAVKNLSQVANDLGAVVLHVSTDYVFDGSSKRPYQESDLAKPMGVYGTSKLAGEKTLKESCDRSVILRTSWVYSEYGKNFFKTMARLGQELESIKIVDDQQGNPTDARLLGDTLLRMVENWNERYLGQIYHLSGDQSKTWAEFAEDIFQRAYQEGLLWSIPKVKKISSTEFAAIAPRPANSVLDNTKIESQLKLRRLSYSDSIDRVLRALKKEKLK